MRSEYSGGHSLGVDVGVANGRKFTRRKKLRIVRIEVIIVSLREAGN